MNTSPARPRPAGYGAELADPSPGTPAFPRRAVRPSVPDSEIPLFSAGKWQLSLLDEKETAVSVPVIWEQFPPVLAAAFKRASWALINIPTPEIIQTRAGSGTRSRLRPSSLNHTIRAWKYFAHWLRSRDVTTLAQVTRDLLGDYAALLRDHGYRRDYCQRHLLALTRLWAYAPYLLPADRIPRPPWDDDAEEYLTAPSGDAAGDNARIPIHPATMSPLLVWALRFVTDFAEDILAAQAESRRLRASIRQRAQPEGTSIVRSYLAGLRDQGQPVPGLPPEGVYARAISAREQRPPKPTVNVRYIAGLLGVTTAQVKYVAIRQPGNVGGIAIAGTAPLTARPRGRIGTQTWLPEFDFDEAAVLAMHLSTAALITVSYLSGMRPEEVLHLRRGCCSTDPDPASPASSDGVVRYRVTGHHFKGVLDENGNQIGTGEVRDQPWTVIAPVAAAIAVLERLEDDDLLFPRQIGSVLTKPRSAEAYRGRALTSTLAAARIAGFAAYATRLAERHGRPHEMIPADPDGPLNMSRFRRTVAWFVNRLPGGRVALGIQYGHVHLTMSESYGNRSRADLLEIIDLEQARSIAGTLADAAGRLHNGEGVSGPAAARYISSVREFKTTYAGAYLSRRQHRALLANPKLRVFDHAQAMLACNHNPLTALCDPERGQPGRAPATPSQDRCDPACANIARTDTHAARIREEIDQLDEEIASGLNPHPVQQRLTQRRTALQLLVDRHDQTRITVKNFPEETL